MRPLLGAGCLKTWAPITTMLPNTSKILFIDGPVGPLQTLYLPAKGRAVGVAIINHPNPLHGGTFTNKVIHTAAKALTELGFHCYLPNLRGVGESAGSHDYGHGETEDCIRVCEYAQARHPAATLTVLAGFSFGGYVALFAAQHIRPSALLLLGPAVGMYATPAPVAFDAARTLLIHGESDDVVPLQNAFNWAAPQDLPVLVLPQAGHFFHGKLMVLRDLVRRHLPTVLPDNSL